MIFFLPIFRVPKNSLNSLLKFQTVHNLVKSVVTLLYYEDLYR